MKKTLILITVLALSCAGLHAQSTNSNSFVVTNAAPITIQPAITTSSLVVNYILIDALHQRMTIYFVGVSKPVVITGAAFVSFKTSFQGQFGTAIAAYLSANPPTQ
jgi:hypothetical protein